MRKTFRAVDGRRCAIRMTEEQTAENELLKLASIVTPVLAVFLFAIASGLI